MAFAGCLAGLTVGVSSRASEASLVECCVRFGDRVGNDFIAATAGVSGFEMPAALADGCFICCCITACWLVPAGERIEALSVDLPRPRSGIAATAIFLDDDGLTVSRETDGRCCIDFGAGSAVLRWEAASIEFDGSGTAVVAVGGADEITGCRL